MTSEETTSGPSAARLGGFALIGLGLLAGVFGVATAVAGSQHESAQSPPPPGSSLLPPTSSERPSTTRTTDKAEPPPRTSTTKPPAPQPPPEKPDESSRVVVRVYNNSTITGLAHRAAEDFRKAGYDVPEIGNYSAGRIYTTTVYFRPGTGEEEQARQVAERFGARLEPRFEGLNSATPGVIAIITNDYKGLGQGK